MFVVMPDHIVVEPAFDVGVLECVVGQGRGQVEHGEAHLLEMLEQVGVGP